MFSYFICQFFHIIPNRNKVYYLPTPTLIPSRLSSTYLRAQIHLIPLPHYIPSLTPSKFLEFSLCYLFLLSLLWVSLLFSLICTMIISSLSCGFLSEIISSYSISHTAIRVKTLQQFSIAHRKKVQIPQLGIQCSFII